MKQQNGYGTLLTNSRFEAFLWTQFLGAFNDNVYKMIVSIMAVRVAGAATGSRYLALAGAVFVIPFLLFAGYAGQLADRFSKTRVLQITKSLEIVAMLMGIVALRSGRIDLLLIVLFLLATQANFFSPAKYGILPEMVSEADLSRANGLLELTTFVAIVIGTSFGTFLFERWEHDPARMGLTLLGIAVAGSLFSLHIQKVPAASAVAGVRDRFRLNPFSEVVTGAKEILRHRTLLLCVLGNAWFWFVGALFQLALLLAGKEVWHVSETHVGYLITALAAGIGLGSVAAGTISGRHIELGLAPAGCFLMGVGGVMLGLTSSYTQALGWLALLGFAGGLFAVPLNAWMQEKSPAQERGRILATNSFISMLGVIAASGTLSLLHDVLHWNAGNILLAAGVAMVAVSCLIVALMPFETFRFMMRCLVTLLFRVELEGAEHIPEAGGALLVANHVSYVDALLVGLSTPRTARFMMRRLFYDMPMGRHVFRLLRAIPVEETTPRAITLALREANQQLANGDLLAIFPEGHITLDGEMQDFKRGYERMVRDLSVPIIPIGISGLYGHPFSCKGGDAFRSWDKVWRPRVAVRVGPPIRELVPPEELRRAVESLTGERS